MSFSESESDFSDDDDRAGGAASGWRHRYDRGQMAERNNIEIPEGCAPQITCDAVGGNDCPSINIKTLTDWNRSENIDNLMDVMISQKFWIRQTLRQLDVPSEHVNLLAILFQKIVQNKTRGSRKQVANIMELVAHSNFIDIHIPTFLSKINHHLMTRIYSSFQAFLDILDYIAIRFSDCSNKCYICVCKIEEIGSRLNILRDGNQLSNMCAQLKMKSCPIPLLEGALVSEGNSKNAREKPIPHDDEDCPPDDFTLKSIFPEMEELESSTEPFLRANKTSGPYRNLKHYTDVQFRLLREDYLAPLRQGLTSYKQALATGTNVKSSDLRFYYGVKLVKMELNSQDGLHFVVKFNPKDLDDDINWEQSKRFLFGSLLCFSKDDFQTVMFATVINREPENLECGLLEVIFQSDLEQVLTSSEYETFVIAETVNFFESYKHVLEGLQEVTELPLKEYILHCESQPKRPNYLPQVATYDIGCIMKEEESKVVNIMDPGDWPQFDNTIMNAAQLEAVKLALTSELAVIQGPPGTGKTYVGFHIMQLMLNNDHIGKRTSSPILVVCYTNHALDQFLEGILEFCEGGIIRVGGRSVSEKLKDCNLKELRQNPRMDKRLKRSINDDLKRSNQRLKKVNYLIKIQWQALLALDTSIQSVVDLENEMTPDQSFSLCDLSRGAARGKEMNVWLKASNANIENHVTKAAEKQLTTLILTGVDTLPDSYLLTVQNARVKFEIRVKIYRSWIQKYLTEMEKRLSKLIASNNNSENKRPIEHCVQGMERASNFILEDEDIFPLMSEGVLDKVKLCIEQEGRINHQSSNVKSWLFGSFQRVEDLLDEIEKIKKLNNMSRMNSYQHRNPQQRVDRDRVVVDDDEDEEYLFEDDLIGFKDNFSDELDDENSSHGSEDNQLVDQFRNVVVNFRENEKREDLLLQRVKVLGIELSQEEEGDSEEGAEFQTPQQMNYSQVFKLIRKARPMEEDEAANIEDVWSLPLRKRYSLYKLWMIRKKQKVAQEIIDLTSTYNHFLAMKKRALSRKDVAILKQGRVIGMTTTGAARYRAMLQEVKPQIVIVEEAAEVLEAHIVSTLNIHCQHLILIGDHQQLRPNPTVFSLAIHYGLEISLFERLVKNDVKHITLQIQHRMSPLISKYVHNIYPLLRNHPSVYEYDSVRGVGSNVFFLSHNFRESSMNDSQSKSNVHEAKFLTKLCKYFLLQNYSGHQITILAAYSGQVTLIKECMEPDLDIFESVRVTSIDNYQGEENDIILLSLVRSNLEQNVGFLKVSNRVCVALSRARQGLFVVGNVFQLEKTSKLWGKIVGKARKHNELGTALRLICRNHPEDEIFVQNAEDFVRNVPEGGCNKMCGFELFCGHMCRRMCHISDPLHKEMLCEEPCRQKCPEGHACVKKCHEECGVCETLVKKTMPLCGHVDRIQCYLDPMEAVCKHPCGFILECQHPCKGLCGDCGRTGQHIDCEEHVEKLWQVCGHTNTAKCCTDTKLEPCPAKCLTKLDCEHKCKGTCGGCLSKRVHRICKSKCKEALPCGHQCQGQCSAPCPPCKQRCPTLCRHTACSKTYCGEICEVCVENCAFTCKHKKCTDKCGDNCYESPCGKLCPQRTSCKHRCNSICGENCVCCKCEENNFRLIDFSKSSPGKVVFADEDRRKKCNLDKETIYMKIPRCNHIFTLKQLDKHVNDFDPHGTSYIRCPACPNSIQTIHRYDEINKKRFNAREEKKQKLEKFTRASDAEIENVRCSLEIVEEFCPFDLEHHIKHNQIPVRKSHIDALRLLARFAFVLYNVYDIHTEFNAEMPFQLERWKESIRQQQTGITSQYEKEMTFELHRLLIVEQIISCKSIIECHDLSLPEDLKHEYKQLMKQISMKLTPQVRDKADSFIEKLYQYLDTCSKEIKMAANKLGKKSMLAKIILNKANHKELCDILEDEDLLPIPVSVKPEEDTDDDDDDDDDDAIDASEESQSFDENESST